MNKKADISTTILVLMSLILVAVTLINFVYGSGKAEIKMFDARFLEKLYLQEEGIKYGINIALQNSIIKSYDEIVNEKIFFSQNFGQDYVQFPDEFRIAWVYYNLEEKIKKNFGQEIAKMQFPEADNQIISSFKQLVAERESLEGMFVLSIPVSGKSVTLTTDAQSHFTIQMIKSVANKETIYVWGFIPASEFGEIQQSVILNYVPKINFSFDITSLGINDFGEIYNAAKECKQIDNLQMQNCLNQKLTNFESSVLDISVDNLSDKSVALTSKKQFTIDGTLKNIVIPFRMQ